MKKCATLIFVLFLFNTSSTYSHVQHYKKIKYLKYDLFFNDQLIGYHSFNFFNKDDFLTIESEGSFKVSKLGINLIKYQTKGRAIYQKNQLIKFSSETIQNDKKKYVNIDLRENVLKINGSSFNGEIDKKTMISSLWNHEIVTKDKQISSISGRINNQKVKFLGKKDIFIGEKQISALNFHILSDDEKPPKEKKLNIKIWYDAKSLLWLKATYFKMGNWEYRLSEAKF
tara:strand:+ start:129 stop:812 length:684 start_codon:yes stop_codon:yes gene_type:complete